MKREPDVTDLPQTPSTDFTLWDTDTNNVLGSYSTEADALRAVAGLIAANGPQIADDLTIVASAATEERERIEKPWREALATIRRFARHKDTCPEYPEPCRCGYGPANDAARALLSEAKP